MDAEKRAELVKRLWENSARRNRPKVLCQIGQFLPGFSAEFLDEERTRELGKLFRNIVRQLPELSIGGFADCGPHLDLFSGRACRVVFFHSATRGCGALLCSFEDLLSHADDFRQSLGPTFLFMQPEGRFGFCYEPGEYEDFLRYWGAACPPSQMPKMASNP